MFTVPWKALSRLFHFGMQKYLQWFHAPWKTLSRLFHFGMQMFAGFHAPWKALSRVVSFWYAKIFTVVSCTLESFKYIVADNSGEQWQKRSEWQWCASWSSPTWHNLSIVQTEAIKYETSTQISPTYASPIWKLNTAYFNTAFKAPWHGMFC